MSRKIRILVGKPGLDGHDRGAKVVARALSDAGYEVVYTGLHQTPEMIAAAAVQEDVDAVGLSIMSGAHMTLFPAVIEALRARGAAEVLVFGGGIVPDDDIATLRGLGVAAIFKPGASTKEIIDWVETNIRPRLEGTDMNALILITLALANVQGAAEANAVTEALVAAEPKLHRCWEIAAANDYKVAGKLELTVTVGDKGKAKSVALKSDSIGQKPLEECVIKVFSDATFGAPFKPGDQVDVPVTFKAESNVTLRAADAPVYKLKGTTGLAKILVDKQTAGADKASLIWVDLPPGSRWVRPSPKGTAFVYVRQGRAKFGSIAAAMDDAVIIPDGSAPLILPSMRTELVMLLVPPGAEAALRDGTKTPPPTVGTDVRVTKMNAAQRHEILGGKGSVKIYFDDDKQASVMRQHFEGGAQVPEHQHDGAAEYLYITEGTGELSVDGDKYPVGPFTAVYIPPNTKHSLTVGERKIEAIQFYTPARPEQRFKGAK